MNDKKHHASNPMSPIAAGIAGAVAGGVAVAAAVVLSDKKNREKVAEVLVDAKDTVTEYVDTLKSEPVVKKATEKIADVVDEAKKKVKSMT